MLQEYPLSPAELQAAADGLATDPAHLHTLSADLSTVALGQGAHFLSLPLSLLLHDFTALCIGLLPSSAHATASKHADTHTCFFHHLLLLMPLLLIHALGTGMCCCHAR